MMIGMTCVQQYLPVHFTRKQAERCGKHVCMKWFELLNLEFCFCLGSGGGPRFAGASTLLQGNINM